MEVIFVLQPLGGLAVEGGTLISPGGVRQGWSEAGMEGGREGGEGETHQVSMLV